MPLTLNRRQALTITAAALTAAAWGGATVPALAAKNDSDDLIKKFTGGKTPVEGRVRLDLPEIAENGNTVPMTVSVESPMTEADHVESIHIFNQKNPQPYVAAFHLGPRAGKASVATRIRLADSQRVIDGSLWSASADIIVTLAACTEQ